MKKLLALMTFTLLAGFAGGESYEDQVAERLKPEGNVCVEGEPCPTANVATATAEESGPQSGEEVYNSACAACHNSGALGAPRLGVAEEWSARLDKGIETLYDNAINGINQMPAKGGNPNLSDEAVKAAVDYMVEQVQ